MPLPIVHPGMSVTINRRHAGSLVSWSVAQQDVALFLTMALIPASHGSAYAPGEEHDIWMVYVPTGQNIFHIHGQVAAYDFTVDGQGSLKHLAYVITDQESIDVLAMVAGQKP